MLDNLLHTVLVFVLFILVIVVFLLVLGRFGSFLVYTGGDLVGNIIFATGFVVGDGGYNYVLNRLQRDMGRQCMREDVRGIVSVARLSPRT